MDDLSFRLGNRAVGNDRRRAGPRDARRGPDAAVPTGRTTVCLAGADMGATLDGAPVARWRAVDVARRRDAAPRRGRRRRGCAPTCCRARRVRRARAPRQPGHLHARRLRRPRRAGAAAGDVLRLGAGPRPAGRRRRPSRRRPARARPGVGRSACSRAPTAPPSSSPPTGRRRSLATDVGGALQLRPHRRAAGRADARLGPHRTAARPACTRRTSTTRPTRSAPSTSPATCRSSSVPTARASAGSSARSRSSPTERWKLGQLAAGDTVRFVRGRATARRPRPADRPHRPPDARSLAGGAGTRVAAADDDRPGRHLPPRRRPTTCSSSTAPMVLDLDLRAAGPRADASGSRRPERRRASSTSRPGIRSLQVHVDADRAHGRARLLDARARGRRRRCPPTTTVGVPSRIVHLPLSWDDPATREAIDATCGSSATTPRGARGTSSSSAASTASTTIDDVHRIVFDASYLVLGLGDVYLGAPVATPARPPPPPRHHQVQPGPHLDARERRRHRRRLPVHLRHGGAGRLPVRRAHRPGVEPLPAVPPDHARAPVAAALLRPDPLPPGRRRRAASTCAPTVGGPRRGPRRGRRCSDWPTTGRSLAANDDDIAAFRTRQRAAFADERARWEASGELAGPPSWPRRPTTVAARAGGGAAVDAPPGAGLVVGPVVGQGRRRVGGRRRRRRGRRPRGRARGHEDGGVGAGRPGRTRDVGGLPSGPARHGRAAARRGRARMTAGVDAALASLDASRAGLASGAVDAGRRRRGRARSPRRAGRRRPGSTTSRPTSSGPRRAPSGRRGPRPTGRCGASRSR